MTTLPYAVVDVFTARPFTGNPLAVVLDADGVPDDRMLAVARETRLSETTFVQSPDRDADYRNRIWMPTGEIPLAGHPSLGTAVAVARARGVREATFTQETRAGLQEVAVRCDGRSGFASMLGPKPVFGTTVPAADLAAALSLRADDLLPEPTLASSPLTLALALAARRDVLGRAVPRYDELHDLLAPLGAAGVYLAVADRRAGTAAARAFGTTVAIGEDPATGAGAAGLGAWLARDGGPAAWLVAQGVEMGRPSSLEVAVEPGGVRIGGPAVVVVEGTLAGLSPR